MGARAVNQRNAQRIQRTLSRLPHFMRDWIAEQGGARKVAERLGVRRQAVYAWALGQSLPSIDTLMAIRLAYGVDLNAFIMGHRPGRPTNHKTNNSQTR